MKTLILLLFILIAGCTPPPATVPKADYSKLTDSVEILNQLHLQSVAIILSLQDSIVDLKDRPLMSSEQFLTLYKYDRLYKYYRICVNKPTQWKYYKGWSIRVFEQ